MTNFRQIKSNILALRYLIREEKSYSSGMNFSKKLFCLSKGFSSEKYSLYEFKKHNFNEYLSDFLRHKTHMINGPYSIVLNDKLLFSRILSNENVVPSTFGKIDRGNIFLNNSESNINEFIKLLKDKNRLIIKKQDGGGAEEIYRVESSVEGITVNNKKISIDEFLNFISTLKNNLICECLIQADYANKIFSHTVNTIRIITMRDPETNKVFIPIAVHKFGSRKTEPADNVWRGGLTALVDIDTGIIKKPALHHDKNKKIEWVTNHPDTEEVIEGVKIPNWDSVKSAIISVAEKLDFLQYVGWDLVVTNDGIRIIEGNNYSDVNILQIHQPLLKDEKVKQFYKYHGIIK